MQSPGKKINIKGALFVSRLVSKNNLLFRLVWTIICHLRIEKEKNISITGTFYPIFEQV